MAATKCRELVIRGMILPSREEEKEVSKGCTERETVDIWMPNFQAAEDESVPSTGVSGIKARGIPQSCVAGRWHQDL